MDSPAPDPAPHRPRWRSPAGLFALLILGVAPNVLVATAAALLHGDRALVDVDYFVIAAIDPFVGRLALVALLAMVLAFDVAFAFAPTFHFGPGEVLAAVEQVRHFTGPAVLVAAVVVMMVVAIAWALVLIRGRRTAAGRVRLPLLCAAVVGLVYAADVANGSSALLWRPHTVLRADVATSVIGAQYARDLSTPLATRTTLPAATDPLRDAVARAAGSSWTGPSKIVIVTVESMGVPRGVSLAEMFSMFATPAIRSRFEVRTGSVPFFGGTTSGELRELCGARMSHVSALQRTLDDCLPARLHALGFRTVAYHGYTGELFRRSEWYRRLGFEQMHFQPDLESAAPLPECGAMFRGVCDSTMIGVLRQELIRDPSARELLYWMTLSTHFPIDPRTGENEPACEALGPTADVASACALWHAMLPALRGIAAMASDTSLQPAWYILAGDHSPPPLLSDPRLFESERVAWVSLRPR